MEISNSEVEANLKLFNLITKEKDLYKVLNLGEDLLGTPISYFDCYSNSNFVSSGFYRWNQNLFDSLIHNDNFLSNIENTMDDTPFILNVEGNFKILVSKVYYCDSHIGYIFIPEIVNALELLNSNIVKLLGETCAIINLLNNNVSPTENSLSNENEIFEQILNKKYKTINDFNLVSRNCSFKKYNQFHILYICISSNYLNGIDKELTLKAENLKIGLWNKKDENGIILMVGLNKDSMSFNDLLKDFEKTYVNKEIFIGVSDPFTHILSTYDHFKKVESLILHSKNSNPNKKIHFYDNYKFKFFLKDVNQYVQTSNNYISYKVINILNYDIQNKTDYAQTLIAYLSALLSPQVTSETLFIHRNTVIYRINKIKELFDIDFTDANQCFQLYFSFQLLVTRGWGRTT